ncbi:hypothetical protein QBC35DRAFT_59274 [Podospora australis]|uniref:MARVEL domain-containing protein n=1 Tax=Podospora australis TaxID=1536484 RepID=A0AAN7AEM0_9PEZI|nr:hypothetical protein QBC35DRAFT_59274 [Podospora australis]
MESTTFSKPPPPHISPPGMYYTKLAFRVIQFTLSIAMLGCAGSIISTGIWAIGSLIVVAPVTVVSFCWALAEGICIVVRAGHRGIHPGANVALDLLLWLAFIILTVVLFLVGVATTVISDVYSGGNDWSGYNRDSGSSSSPYGGSSSSSRDRYNYDNEVDKQLEAVAAKGQALIGLGATLVILHFVTFVIACYETNVRNRKKHTTVVIQQAPAAPLPGHPGNPVTYGVAPVSDSPAYGYAPNNYQKA